MHKKEMESDRAMMPVAIAAIYAILPTATLEKAFASIFACYTMSLSSSTRASALLRSLGLNPVPNHDASRHGYLETITRSPVPHDNQDRLTEETETIEFLEAVQYLVDMFGLFPKDVLEGNAYFYARVALQCDAIGNTVWSQSQKYWAFDLDSTRQISPNNERALYYARPDDLLKLVHIIPTYHP